MLPSVRSLPTVSRRVCIFVVPTSVWQLYVPDCTAPIRTRVHLNTSSVRCLVLFGIARRLMHEIIKVFIT